ncbi:MAG: site-specific integrase [Terriglobales bacterium]
MTHLRKIMLQELERRNYAQTTIDCYLHAVEHFSQYFHRSPDQLGPEHIREYQAALFTKWKLAPNTVNQRLAGLRFFYIQTLKKAWSVAETPYPKKTFRLPTILSQEEVARLIDSARTPFHRIVLMTLYATGMRRAEPARLKIRDIDPLCPQNPTHLHLTPCSTLRHRVALPRVSLQQHSIPIASVAPATPSSRCIESAPTSTPINPRGFPWGASNTALRLLANVVGTRLKT